MQVCNICGAQEDGGNISLEADRDRHIPVSNKDLFYTRCCQYAIAKGKKGCLNQDGKVLDLPYLRMKPISGDAS